MAAPAAPHPTLHTPGEWLLETRPAGVTAFTVYSAVTQLHIAKVHGVGNARLIVAAPILLARLKSLVDQCDHVSPFAGKTGVRGVREASKFLKATDDARAALALVAGS